MKTFKMKSMQAAIIAGLGALGVAGALQSVKINKSENITIPFPKPPKQDRRGRSFNPKIGQGKHVSRRSMTGHRFSNKKGKGK